MFYFYLFLFFLFVVVALCVLVACGCAVYVVSSFMFMYMYMSRTWFVDTYRACTVSSLYAIFIGWAMSISYKYKLPVLLVQAS
jgi:hypothetical protein